MDDVNFFREGVAPGGLQSGIEVKILICYLLKSVKTPLTKDQMTNVFLENGLVNYFELSKSLKELVQSKHIQMNLKGEEEEYTIPDLGKETALSLERSLPFSVRDKALCSALKLLARIKRETENKVEISKSEDGYHICLRILDVGSDLLNLTLLVPDRMQAERVKDAFLENPQSVYEGVLSLLTNYKRL